MVHAAMRLVFHVKPPGVSATRRRIDIAAVQSLGGIYESEM
jgi:hypothetical protein